MGHACGQASEFREALFVGEANLLAEVTDGLDHQLPRLAVAGQGHGGGVGLHVQPGSVAAAMALDHPQRLARAQHLSERAGDQGLWAGTLLAVGLGIAGGTQVESWVRRLGRRWTRLHRLVYLAAVLAVVHYTWLVKSDIRVPLLYGALVLGLLALRLPPVRRAMAGLGGRWKHRPAG